MKHITSLFLTISLIMSAQALNAETITDTYATGDTLTAETLNNIKSAVNDNNTRLTTVEAVAGVSADFTGYALPFSADGDPKNIVIARRLNRDGTINYLIRSRYANSSEQISIQGVNTVRPLIANYGFVTVDSSGTITGINNYIEAPLTEVYENYVIESSSFDTTSLIKTVDNDTGSELWSCGTTVGVIQVCNIDVRDSGASTRDFESIRVMGLLGAGEIDGIAFTNMRGSQRSYGDSAWYEVRAKGIGRVLKINHDRAVEKVIFYQVDGNADGSLAGTPFAAGQLLENFLR